MKDYRLFDISDFVIDEDFIRWVHRGKADDDFWNHWLKQNPGKHMVALTLKDLCAFPHIVEFALKKKSGGWLFLRIHLKNKKN